MSLLSLWKQHTVTIEPHLGTNGYGQDMFGPAVEVQGWLEQKVKNIRDENGSETVSTAQFYCELGTSAPPRSRGTFPDGRTSLVILSAPMDAGTLPLPEHLVIHFE
ncbi:hypothetical protein [Glycomyces paridis]|uniref:Head-tail adaptor protein n=1 Tax=Glycomyces paridis TaxID=2126555 RepID=A0A4S8P6W4_9ACTN|nr:hypothetical protein [Glycomyces paridis]THV26008.1 hypothetical protein E9998_19940 [Glycomyces paridis]